MPRFHVPARHASTSGRKRSYGSTSISVLGLMFTASVVTAIFWFDLIPLKVKFATLDAPIPSGKRASPGHITEMHPGLELTRYLNQIRYYVDKDLKAACEASEKAIRLVEKYPDTVHQSSAVAMRLKGVHLALLAKDQRYPECCRQIEILIDSCKRKLDDYDQRGILNLPLERDVLAFAGDDPGAEASEYRSASAADLTEIEERKSVFQALWDAYHLLTGLYLASDSPMKDVKKAKEPIENMLSALEAEFGSSFERAPRKARAGMIEIDKPTIHDYLIGVLRPFIDNTSPEYSPELALKLSCAASELLLPLESSHGSPPCLRMYHLQNIANLVLDLACESAPEGLLTTHEDRLYLEEARRVQQRVLQLTTDIDPHKRDKICDHVQFEGFVSMAKIAWRYGDEGTGDQELEKATRLANSMNRPFYKEIIRRMDKDPHKTPMKYWEPVSKEECERLAALEAEIDRKDTQIDTV